MIKKIVFLTFLCILTYIIIPIPKYRELNHLSIIKNITIECNKKCTITLEEIIPIREENKIHYQCKNYQLKGKSIINAKQELEKKNDKIFFYKDTKYLYTNCSNKKEISKIFHIPKEKIKPIPKEKANCNN